MKKPNEKPNQLNVSKNMDQILNFLDQNKTFTYQMKDNVVFIQQGEDKKNIRFDFHMVDKVLIRQDMDGSHFLQINFSNQLKILITKNLIGFKPIEIIGFDSAKIPKVVTTVDLQSITRAIEELYENDDNLQTATELEVLKKVFQSIMVGAETVGFDMRSEKDWFARYLLSHSAACA